jgi:hypothetical protein
MRLVATVFEITFFFPEFSAHELESIKFIYHSIKNWVVLGEFTGIFLRLRPIQSPDGIDSGMPCRLSFYTIQTNGVSCIRSDLLLYRTHLA